MPQGKFDQVRLLRGGADDGLEVTGAFDPKLDTGQELVGAVFIGFMIIQNDKDGHPTRIANGVTSWSWPSGPVGPDRLPEFRGKIAPGEAASITAGDARAIGVAAQVTHVPNTPEIPPNVEFFTWCVPMQVEVVDS